jgi:hypothetical protein
LGVKRAVKTTIKIIAVLVAVPFGLIVILLCVYLGYGFYQETVLPDVCKNFAYHKSMRVQTQYIQDEFSDRINKMYSTPITEDALKKSLIKQGFRLPKYPNPDQLPKVWGYAENNVIPCDQSWVVEWTMQDDGIAHDIHGTYNSSCM